MSKKSYDSYDSGRRDARHGDDYKKPHDYWVTNDTQKQCNDDYKRGYNDETEKQKKR